MAALAERCEPTGRVDRATGQLELLCRTPASYSDTDTTTARTVDRMCARISQSLGDPLLQNLAKVVRRKWALGNDTQTAAPWAVFWFCKHAIIFVPDEISVFADFSERDKVDYLVAPHKLIRRKRMQGDCDEFTMMACALLLLNGVDCEIVTVACSPKRPGEWSHVYCRAILPDGRHMPIDATPAGLYPGWEVPAYDVQRKQVWNMDAQPIADAGSAQMGGIGLQGYRSRGLGDDGTDVLGNPIGTTYAGPPTDTSASNLWTALTGQPISPAGIPGVVGMPSTSSGTPWWAPLANTIANAGVQLGKIAILPSGSSLLPNGALIAGGANPNLLLGASSLNAGSLLFWAAIALGGVLLLQAVAKK